MALDKFTVSNPARHAITLYDEFKAFAFKGNVIDLAVGVVVGGAFTGIVKSLVDHIVMPLVNVVVPSDNHFKDWAWTVGKIKVPYGLFLADVVNFLVIAAALFFFTVKFLGWLMRTKKAEAEALPSLTKDQMLMEEIRDALQARPPASAASRSANRKSGCLGVM